MPHSTKNGRKRRRPAADTEAPRPEPPPPPPQVLVDLLRSDSSVLDYFTSLQTCLDADVAQWKNRALSYKQECNDLTQQLEEARKQQQRTTKPPPRKRKQSKTRKKNTTSTKASVADDSVQDGPAEIDNGKRQSTTTNGHAVDEAAFFFLSDSDASGVGNDTTVVFQNHEPTPVDWTVYGFLLKAFNNLRQLGVDLVVEETVESKGQLEGAATTQQLASSESKQETSTTLLRRSDEEVIADLLHAVHTLARIQLHLKDSEPHPPFSTDSRHIPCCDIESHPAAQGRECILEAFCIMDLYCTRMLENEWNELYPEAADEAILVGMRDRKGLVDLFLSSLIGEISDFWVVADRSPRLVNTGLHYEALEEVGIVPFAGSWGAKSGARLSGIAERCLLAQLVTGILHRRNEDQDAAALIWRYLLSAVPSFGVEDYPRLPPVLSLSVLESLLRPYAHSTELLQLHALESSNDKIPSLLRRAFALAVHASWCVWNLRLASADNRITDLSRVELAAFDRLLESQSSWLPNPRDGKKLVEICSDARSLLTDALNCGRPSAEAMSGAASKTCEATLAVQVALIIMGDMQSVLDTCRSSVGRADRDVRFACCSAFRLLQVRQIDTFRAKQGSLTETSALAAHSVSNQLMNSVDSSSKTSKPSSDNVEATIKCYMQLSTAENIYALLHWLSRCEIRESRRTNLATAVSYYLGTPLAVRKAPVVRVINLERRCDRMKTFMAQAQSQRVLVAKAVARLDADDDTYSRPSSVDSSFDATYVWGSHGFDGQGGLVEVASRLSKEIGESRSLSDFVESHWRPHDLKAFDRDARNDESLVLLSPSEKACALSHIGSWKGVYRSLVSSVPVNKDDPRHGISFPFLISGYASGRPLLHSNEHMPPTPVCVILEDDAILVDRFAHRLSSLLMELPRDFHFCSIGYSRPKTAPIAKYSTNLGIPSCIWYLTGYILSLEGAKHLLNSLPVRGPVDAWIGLKMCANWDNVFGQSMGVGARASTITSELPSRKDLAQILKFRAFAALVPLCSQKVNTTTDTSAGRSWRQRDTDITYSGNL